MTCMDTAEVHFNRLLLPWRLADINQTTSASHLISFKAENIRIQNVRFGCKTCNMSAELMWNLKPEKSIKLSGPLTRLTRPL